jgi:hypothetical protein
MIYKIQRPLADPDDPWLAYTEGRQNIVLFEPSVELVSRMRGRTKMYIDAVHTPKHPDTFTDVMEVTGQDF